MTTAYVETGSDAARSVVGRCATASLAAGRSRLKLLHALSELHLDIYFVEATLSHPGENRMDIAHQSQAVRLQHDRLYQRAVETIAWTVNAANTSASLAQDVALNTSNSPDVQLHQKLLDPWILGVVLQSILTGVIASQTHNLYLKRSSFSCRTALAASFLFCTNCASFGTQTNTLWYFSMSSLGDIQYLMQSCTSKG